MNVDKIIMVNTYQLLIDKIKDMTPAKAAELCNFSENHMKGIVMRRNLLSKDKVIELTDMIFEKEEK